MAAETREIRVSEPLTEVAEARRNGHADPLDNDDWTRANEAALIEAISEGQRADVWEEFPLSRYSVKTPDGAAKPIVIRLRGLTEEEMKRAEKRGQVPTGKRRMGGGQETEQDRWLYFRHMILMATHADDGEKLWKSQALRTKLQVAGQVDLIGAVMLSGEVARAAEVIIRLSGFVDIDDLTKSADTSEG